MRAFRSAQLLRSCIRSAQPTLPSFGATRITILGTRGLSTPPGAGPPPDATSPFSGPVNRLLEPIGGQPAPGSASAATASTGKPHEIPLVSDGTSTAATFPGEKVYTDASDGASLNGSASESAASVPTETIANGLDTSGAATESTTNGAGAVVDAVGAGASGVDASVVAQVAEQVTYSGWSEALLTPTYWLLNTMHDTNGLAWWSTIAVSTVLVRTVLIPVTLYIMQNSAKLAAIQPEMKVRQARIMELYKTGQQAKAQKMMDENREFMKGAGVNPGRVLMGPLMQIPIFLSFFVAIRRLAATDPSFSTGGIAWFVDLSVRDPYFVMPIFCGLSLFAMFEYGSDSGQNPQMMTPVMKTMMRFMAAGSVFATYWFPAAVFCYWVPNNLFSMGFSLIAKSKPVKKALNLDVKLAEIPGTKEFMRAKRVAPHAPLSDEQISSVSAAASLLSKKQASNAAVKPKLYSSNPNKKSRKKVKL